MGNTARIGSANAGNAFLRANRVGHPDSDSEVLSKVDNTIGKLEAIVHKAGEAGSDVLAFPEMVPGPPDVIVDINCRAVTVGHGHWQEAEDLLHAGKTAEAKAAYERMIRGYPCSWFDRTARERLASIRSSGNG